MDPIRDPLAGPAPRDVQTRAAHLAQDAFAEAFRLTLESAPAERQQGVAEVVARLVAWARSDAGSDAAALRLALLLCGLDQWGVAYSQVFGAEAMAGLSELVSGLRANLAAAEVGCCEGYFEQVVGEEASGFGFKAELRKAIHLALWHSMIAEEDREGAVGILKRLGGMMLGLVDAMPESGWVIVADTLADIQIRCLAHGLAAEGLGAETTRDLFAVLGRQLPERQRERIMAAANQAVVAWQQAARDVH